MARLAAGLQQGHAGLRIGRKPVGQHAAGGAAADHDEIMLVRHAPPCIQAATALDCAARNRFRTDSAMAFDTLLRPDHRGRPRELRNRIVHVATVTGLGKDRAVTDRLIAYHAARAQGGTAMIVTELMNVHPTSTGAPILVSLHDEANLGGLYALGRGGGAPRLAG